MPCDALPLEGPERQVIWESEALRPDAAQATAPPAFRPETAVASVQVGTSKPQLQTLRFRYQYETQPDQTYVLTKQFTVWSNGVVCSTMVLSNLVSGDGFSRWETNEIRPVLEQGRAVFKLGSVVLAHALARHTALGLCRITLEPYRPTCAACNSAESLPPGQPGPRLDGVHLSFSLGKTWHGQPVGELCFASAVPTPQMWKAKGLRLLTLPGAVAGFVEPGSSALRQIHAPQCWVDICGLGASGYQLRFFGAQPGLGSGLLPTHGVLPFVTWTVENPDGDRGTNRLRVVETTGARNVTNLFSWSPALQQWTFISGNGLRKQVQRAAWERAGPFFSDVRQTFEPKTDQLVSQALSRYRRFSWGDALCEEVAGVGIEAQTNSYSYYDVPGSPTLGRLRQVIYADAYWESYEYDSAGRLRSRFSPYGTVGPRDLQNARKLSYDYTPWIAYGDDGTAFALQPRTLAETIRGWTVQKEYRVAGSNVTVLVQCAANSQKPFDGPVLCTTNTYNLIAEPASGLPRGRSVAPAQSVCRLLSAATPDGTVSFYSESTGPEFSTNVVLWGQPRPGLRAVARGSRTVMVNGRFGQAVLKEVFDIAPGRSDVLIQRERYDYAVDSQRSYSVQFLNGSSNTVQGGCCGPASIQAEDGSVVIYSYDPLKRLASESRIVDGTQAVTTIFTFDAANRLLSTERIGTDGLSRGLLRRASYDTAGRLRRQTNALGGVTVCEYRYDPSGRAETLIVNPDGGTTVETYHRDRTLYRVSGTAVYGVQHEPGLTREGFRFTTETKLDPAGRPTREWVKRYTDAFGRLFRTEYPDGAHEDRFYNGQGQLSAERDADGVLTVYGYNALGERELSAVRTSKTNQSQVIGFSGTDRITANLRDIAFEPNRGYVHRVRTYVWGESNSAASNLVATQETSVDDWSSWSTAWNTGSGATTLSTLSNAPGGLQFQYDYAPAGPFTLRCFRYGRLNWTETHDAAGSLLTRTEYSYDVYNRLATATDLRNGTTRYSYNEADLLTELTLPPAKPGETPVTTRTVYDAMMRVTRTIYPDQQSAYTEYYPTGKIRKTHGARMFPAEYVYDYAGRVQTLRTGPGPEAELTWKYSPLRGWLDAKRYPNGFGPDYAHTPGARLRERLWVRQATGSQQRVATRYSYGPYGELQAVTYNDGLTPNLSFAYDRRGRLVTASAGEARTVLTYDNADQLLSESGVNGPLSGFVLNHGYDSVLRKSKLSLSAGNSVLLSTTYTYDSACRLATVAAEHCSAAYAYVPNAQLVQSVALRQGQKTLLRRESEYDNQERLVSVTSSAAGLGSLRFQYTYNSVDQPERVTWPDASYWRYEFESMGQLTRARRFNRDGSPIAGQEFNYRFDENGNRLASLDLPRQAVRAVAFARQPERVGRAVSSAPPNLNFVAQPAVVNAAGGADQSDPDGNLAQDGQWHYTWDAENRLVRMESLANAPNRVRLDFEYDWKNRRTGKRVSMWGGGGWLPRHEYRFVYDAWNIVAEIRGAPTNTAALRFLPAQARVRTYTWGLDLSGTWSEAGGAGGLLFITAQPLPNAPAETLLPAYDGRGNVTVLIAAADGKTAALYEYGPFGENLLTREVRPDRNPFRFCTQYGDTETEALCFAQRSYHPAMGKWMNRDPLLDYGFWNTIARDFEQLETALDWTMYRGQDYVFAGNTPVTRFDLFGLASSCDGLVSKALESERNDKLLRRIARRGCECPSIHGTDRGGECLFPGFLGDYDCRSKSGRICCMNLERRSELDRVVYHELVHGVDCCRNGLMTCEDRVCSELVAYYLADCQWLPNRVQCALQQMRASMASHLKCFPAMTRAGDTTARECLKKWKAAERADRP